MRIVIGDYGCRMAVIAFDGYDSMVNIRKSWLKIDGKIARHHPCHIVVFQSLKERRFSAPLDQQTNIIRGAVDRLRNVLAVAYVSNEHTTNIYAVGYAKQFGVNIKRFRSIDDAIAWLSEQPHKPGCPCAT